jgi:hypothetical protein
MPRKSVFTNEKGGQGDKIGDRTFGVHDSLREAFREFDWTVSRAVSVLRTAVAS